jgi:reductive dehalogenase
MPESALEGAMSSDRAEIPDLRVDERDVMFSRAALQPGTPAYAAYYAGHAELRKTDDALRALPPLLTPGAAYYQPDVMAEALAHFEAIDALVADSDWVETWRNRVQSALDPSSTLKEAALDLGAVAVGWAPLDPAFIYSHKGRFPEDHGRPVSLTHDHVLVFLVEMNWEEMQRAPKAPTLRESAKQYFRAARVSLNLEALLRACGHGAKHHYDAHYEVILPPLAVQAGLGEMGRNNILVADRFGSRVRIGAVTTDLPARLDRPVDLGVQRFCEVCGKCAESCPSKALETGERRRIRGVAKWPTEVERCYRYWRQVGTDCGVCMAACPFSHRNNPLHNLVRWVVRTSPWSHRLLVWGDALLYGRRWKPRG